VNDDLPTQRASADDRDTVRVPTGSREVVFQRYELQRKLAAGGMGEVWLARDTVQGTEAALKFLKEDFATDTQAVNELKQEVLNSLKLNHQNILRVYRFEVDTAATQITRRYAISMEYIRGMNLRDLRRERKVEYFDVEELQPWALQMCDAIHYAHERKLVHRDIKPANLMLDEQSAVKVCDFGIGRAVTETSSGRTQSNAGTIPYMSRQQREFYKAAPSDDIYAIGATLYDLLTGHPPRYMGKQVAIPFDEKPTRMAEWRKRNNAKGSGRPIPENWERVVELCLCDEPGGRPPTAKAIRDLIEGRPVDMKPGSAVAAGKPAPAPGGSAWKKIAAGLALGAVLAAAGGYYYWAQNVRILPEVQQLVTGGKVTAEEGNKLNAVLRGPDGYEKKLAARLTTEGIDPITWRDYTTLVPAKSEIQGKLRPLLSQGSIKEEEFNLLTKDLGGPDENPYKNLAKQLAYDKTINAAQWRDARAKIVDPSIEKVKLLISAGTLTASEGETLKADHAKTDGSKDATLARSLLEQNAITVEQWRKDRFPAPAGPADPIAERLKPLAAAGTVTAQELEWLHAALAGQKSDSEKTFAERLLTAEITPGVWRAHTAFDYRLKDDVVLDPANLPPAIDLALNDSTTVRLLRINPGNFTRGSGKDELGRRPNELGQENAVITRPYYLGVYEVTQAQYLSLMPRNPSYWRNNPNWPVDQVDWASIAGSNGFLARLNATIGTKHGSLFVADLPTEDEWEYACRAGTQTSFNNGKNITNAYSDVALDQVANYNRAANGSPRDVGSFQPNAWGFFDMHGNVAEWCQDRYIRGGSWQARAANCRVAWRTQISSDAPGSNTNGFRLALHLKDKEAK
jgi:serine/threonine protein kinase/formylglycine-generating enzyme required for sulfatase activity